MWISFVGLLYIFTFNLYVINYSYILEYYLYDWIYEIREFIRSMEGDPIVYQNKCHIVLYGTYNMK